MDTPDDGHHPQERSNVADATTLTDAERKKLEERRDRLMKLMRESDRSGGGPTLDADDRADLMQEWTRIDNLLQRRDDGRR
jgi:hypothetical protein